MAAVRNSEDVLIVGAGPIGLACAVSARRAGADPLVVDAGAVVNSIVHYPIGMTFFTTPDLLEIGGHPLACAGQKPTREEVLKYYRGVVRAEKLRVRTYTRLESASRRGSGLGCELRDPQGAAALELFRAGARVTLVYRRPELKPTVKYWLKPDIENRMKAGEIAARFGAEVLRIEPRAVVIRDAAGREERLPADRVFALTGYHPDFELFRRIGITLDPESSRPDCDPETLETNVTGVYMAGSIKAGRATSEIFIENGRFDGDRIFGAPSPSARNPGGRPA